MRVGVWKLKPTAILYLHALLVRVLLGLAVSLSLYQCVSLCLWRKLALRQPQCVALALRLCHSHSVWLRISERIALSEHLCYVTGVSLRVHLLLVLCEPLAESLCLRLSGLLIQRHSVRISVW